MIATLEKGNRWRHKVALMLGRLGLDWSRIGPSGNGPPLSCSSGTADGGARAIGDAGDDLTVWLNGDPLLILSVECKNEMRYDLAGWLTQAETQAPAGRIPIVIAHRNRKDNAEDGYVIMSGRTFVRLLLALTEKVGR
jgi:hypothetical protein